MKHRFSKPKRFLCFFAGLALCGFGVALSTAPQLGTSPISSLPYVLTFLVPLTFGTWTILINLLFVTGQIVVLKRDFQWIQVSQMAAVCVFGFFIDLGMWLTQLHVPEAYALRLLEQLLGCAVLASGIACQLAANVTYLPGDGLVRAICSRWGWGFSKVKIVFDSTLVLLAILTSLIGTGEINGVREGTILAAVAVGSFIRLYHRPLRTVKVLLVKS